MARTTASSGTYSSRVRPFSGCLSVQTALWSVNSLFLIWTPFNLKVPLVTVHFPLFLPTDMYVHSDVVLRYFILGVGCREAFALVRTSCLHFEVLKFWLKKKLLFVNIHVASWNMGSMGKDSHHFTTHRSLVSLGNLKAFNELSL